MSTEDYTLAMNPSLQISMEQAQARLSEVTAQIARGETPELSIAEREKLRKWETIVGKITSSIDQRLDVVMTTLFTASELKNRQREILQELTRLKALGKGPSG